MKKQPLISVIVASYNYAKYIKETLDSLIRQTNKSFEVIVVDDGSKDQSLPGECNRLY
jgi:glycosyltransferase involved in cell wall biosynthesis